MTGNHIADKGLMGLNLTLVIAAVGVFLYTVMIGERPPIDQEIEARALEANAKKEIQPHFLKLDKMAINIRSQTRRLRFLEIEIHLQTFRKEQLETLEKIRPEMHDSIIDIVGRMKPTELNTLAGKILLEERIKKALNAPFKKKTVKKVLFTKFVVQ